MIGVCQRQYHIAVSLPNSGAGVCRMQNVVRDVDGGRRQCCAYDLSVTNVTPPTLGFTYH